MTAWPDEALATLRPDARTAIVTLTHDPKIDDPGLRAALASEAFYIGCLGSRRTHAARCDRLREAGFGDGDLARIHGPVGLDIGARTPAEIAVSILAQMIAVERTVQAGMKFGPTAPDDCDGAILAHAVYLPDGRIRKGTRLGPADIARLDCGWHRIGHGGPAGAGRS